MLRWSMGFLVISLMAAAFGFYALANTAAFIAKVVFFIFITLFVLSLIGSVFNKPK